MRKILFIFQNFVRTHVFQFKSADYETIRKHQLYFFYFLYQDMLTNIEFGQKSTYFYIYLCEIIILKYTAKICGHTFYWKKNIIC